MEIQYIYEKIIKRDWNYRIRLRNEILTQKKTCQ